MKDDLSAYRDLNFDDYLDNTDVLTKLAKGVGKMADAFDEEDLIRLRWESKRMFIASLIIAHEYFSKRFPDYDSLTADFIISIIKASIVTGYYSGLMEGRGKK